MVNQNKDLIKEQSKKRLKKLKQDLKERDYYDHLKVINLNQLTSTAYHEAGHALIALLHGDLFDVVSATIKPTLSRPGSLSLSPKTIRTLGKVKLNYSPHYSPQKPTKYFYACKMLINVAGCCFQELIDGDDKHKKGFF